MLRNRKTNEVRSWLLVKAKQKKRARSKINLLHGTRSLGNKNREHTFTCMCSSYPKYFLTMLFSLFLFRRFNRWIFRATSLCFCASFPAAFVSGRRHAEKGKKKGNKEEETKDKCEWSNALFPFSYSLLMQNMQIFCNFSVFFFCLISSSHLHFVCELPRLTPHNFIWVCYCCVLSYNLHNRTSISKETKSHPVLTQRFWTVLARK